MKKSLFILWCVLMYNTVYAQRFDFGKVSEEEIKEEVHPLDPEAPAAVLYKKATLKMEYNDKWLYVYEVEARIKIYKKEGFDKATVNVPLYRIGVGKNELFSNLKAFTYTLQNGKIEKEKIGNNAIFDEDYNEFLDLKKFTFPNIKEGVVLEYTYKITFPYISGLPEFYFQEDIPVNFAEYTLKIPEYLGYKSYSKGFFPLQREEKREVNKFSYTYVPTQTAGTSALGSHKTHNASRDYTLFTTKYTANNVPKLVAEEYVNNIDNYLTSIRHELEWVKMPNSELEKIAQNWEDVVKSIYKNDYFGKELAQKNYFEAELDPFLKGVNTNLEKANLIFEFVKNKILWNKNYGYYTKDGVKTAYKNRTGNVAEINLMLTAMLRYAGLKANPVLVSTKSNGIPLFPTRQGFNYVVSAIELPEGALLLDATDTYSSPNILPERALNWFGRLVRSDETSEEVNLMPTKLSRKVINMSIKLNENGRIDGKIRNTLTDHLALQFRTKYADVEEKTYIDQLQNQFISLDIEDYTLQNQKDAYQPIVESYTFSKINSFDKIGDKIYFHPLFFLATIKNPFTAESRAYPIDFKYPTSDSYTVSIAIPDGYQVESVPESAALQLPDGLGKYGFMISQSGNSIQLRVTSDINFTMVPAPYYDVLKQYFKAIVEKETEKIVLVKL
ncbi:MAG: hypothetical protein AUK33_10220 [Flavobacteriaceae bacterium CG2_30_34_30]|nr:MAG: hypothetical protein AUK33_10220 [Flavobacteriaceae bacterium CG2_30_34_30]